MEGMSLSEAQRFRAASLWILRIQPLKNTFFDVLAIKKRSSERRNAMRSFASWRVVQPIHFNANNIKVEQEKPFFFIFFRLRKYPQGRSDIWYHDMKGGSRQGVDSMEVRIWGLRDCLDMTQLHKRQMAKGNGRSFIAFNLVFHLLADRPPYFPFFPFHDINNVISIAHQTWR